MDGERTVLVTGSAGVLGREVCRRLAFERVPFRTFDLAEGDDVRDLVQLTEAARGCGSVVHLAAVPTDLPGMAAEIGRTNLLGVWNVALAAEIAAVRRVVFASSVNAMGIFMGQGLPPSFPIDESIPPRPVTPYSVAKFAGEEIFAALSRRTGIRTICLRFPRLIPENGYSVLRSRWAHSIQDELSPYWEYGAYLDMTDAARAVSAAIECDLHGDHTRMILVDDVLAHVHPIDDLLRGWMPEHVEAAQRALDDVGTLVDGRYAWRTLGMTPGRHWERRR